MYALSQFWSYLAIADTHIRCNVFLQFLDLLKKGLFRLSTLFIKLLENVDLVIFQMSKLLWETATHSFTVKYQNSSSSKKKCLSYIDMKLWMESGCGLRVDPSTELSGKKPNFVTPEKVVQELPSGKLKLKTCIWVSRYLGCLKSCAHKSFITTT